MNCININDAQYKELLEQSKLNPLILKARISIFQDKNGLDSYPKVEDIIKSNEVNQTLKAVDILQSDKAKQVFAKGKKANWSLEKILTELQVPKEQKKIILDKDITDREEIITSLLADNSFVIEINTTKKQEVLNNKTDGFVLNNKYYTHGFDSNGNQSYEVANIIDSENFQMWEPDTYDEFVEISKDDYLKAREQTGENTQYYSNLTVPGGTNYTEQEISTPLITPSIKGHAQFATDNGIGWFRSDEQILNLSNLENLGIIKKVPC